MIPVVAFLAVFFWIVLSAVKYWYYSTVNYNYTYKLDDKTLEELRRPPEHVLEKIRNKHHSSKRKTFIDEPENKNNVENHEDGNRSFRSRTFSANGNDCNKSTSSDGKEKGKGRQRPLTLFEEMDLLQNQKQTKAKNKNGSKYVKGMFDDPLSKLYQEIQELKQQQSDSNSNK